MRKRIDPPAPSRPVRRRPGTSGFFAALLALASLSALSDPVDLTAEARSFVEDAESRLSMAEDLLNRADWIRATNITPDTDWLVQRLLAERTTMTVPLVSAANRFDGKVRDPTVARKLELLKRLLIVPAASTSGAALALAEISGKLSTRYATGSFLHDGETFSLQQAEMTLAKSRDPVTSQAMWEGWRSITPPMRDDYANMVSLANAGAQELGFRDLGAMWRSAYDVPPDDFEREVDALWIRIAPLYDELHTYVRGRLNARHGDEVQPGTGAIRVDLTGNMWGQNWTPVWDIVGPTEQRATFGLGQALKANAYDGRRIVEAAEGFFVSLGLRKLPDSFWDHSQFTRPPERDVDCNPSAWTIYRDDARVKLCLLVTAGEWPVVHHELGHVYYTLAFQDQPFLFRDGVNAGFQEGLGDFIGLSAMMPSYLTRLNLRPANAPDQEDDIAFLLHQALARIPLLAFAISMDKWRWGVFAGEIAPVDYNSAWWSLVERYQQLRPPRSRPADAFDIAAKYHITNNVPYMSYFMASIYLYQFQRAACRMAGVPGPLHRCSIYGSKVVGTKLNQMMASGRSRPTGETLALFTGESRADASALLDYYAPLYQWLRYQNESARRDR